MARELSTEDRRLLELASRPFSNPDRVIGPAYPEMGGAVAKWRRVAAIAGSISAMSKADRHAYGAAVEAAILSKHRLALVGPAVKLEGPPKDVGAAIRARHAAELANYPARERAARKPAVWEAMYAAAMAEKAKPASPRERRIAIETVLAKAAIPATKLNPAQKAWVTRRAKAAANSGQPAR
jgi:hypothetical protein